MKKNKKIFQHSLDFQAKEGISIPATKEVYLKKLKEFEGMAINNAQIDDGIMYSDTLKKYKLIGRTLTLFVVVQRTIEEKRFPSSNYIEAEVFSPVKYRFIFVKNWRLYYKGKIVYDNTRFEEFKSPKQYRGLLTKATLLRVTINSEWTKATFIFTEDLKVVADAFFRTTKMRGRFLAHFFTIVKDPEPFIMHLDFAKPDNVYFTNEIAQLGIVPRKKRPKFIV